VAMAMKESTSMRPRADGIDAWILVCVCVCVSPALPDLQLEQR
jgi:hypothetical protein